MGYFDTIKEAKISGGGVYLKPGHYKVEICDIKSLMSFKKQPLYIVEVKILESNVPELAPGMHASWCVNLNDAPAMGNIKAFIVAATKCEEEEVTPEVAELTCSEAQPLRGYELRGEVAEVTTKKGTPFSKHFWKSAA